MYVRYCEYCGEKFVTKSKLKRFHSKECRKKMALKKEEEGWQPCCTCKNACGGCSWSIDFTPVEGWDAEPTIINDSEGNISSYKINSCPRYIRG